MHQLKRGYNVALVLTDARRQILWINDYFTRMTGYRQDELRGKTLSFLQADRGRRDIADDVQANLALGSRLENEIITYSKSGEPHSRRLVVHAIRDPDDIITHYIAFEIESRKPVGESALDLMHFSSKYQTSSLKGAKSLQLYDRLCEVINSQRLYLDPQLNLPMLAEVLETNTKYLSQVVNHHYGNNLQQFVNVYRIEEAKKRLVEQEYDYLTYFAIGQLCGFKNKSTFYKVFKKFTGHTPHEFVLAYRRRLKRDARRGDSTAGEQE